MPFHFPGGGYGLFGSRPRRLFKLRFDSVGAERVKLVWASSGFSSLLFSALLLIDIAIQDFSKNLGNHLIFDTSSLRSNATLKAVRFTFFDISTLDPSMP